MITEHGISRTPVSGHLDFKKLREEGMEYLRTLCRNTWTDHNLHDPGITTLEILCYALTDLAYRAELVHESFHDESETESRTRYFFPRDQLLQRLPYTKHDYAQYLETLHPELAYAWFEEEPLFSGDKFILGGYEVSLVFKNDVTHGDLNADGVVIKVEGGYLFDVILFNARQERMNWRSFKKIVGCRLDTGSEDNFFVFEQVNCHVSLVLDVIYQNRTQAESVSAKARLSLSKAPASRKKIDLDTLRDPIISALETEDFISSVDSLLRKQRRRDVLMTQVRQSLIACRNLCEDFVSFRFANEQAIRLDAEVMLSRSAAPASEMRLAILDRLDQFLLQLVFDARSTGTKKKSVLYGSNLIEEVMKLAGVEGVRIISMNLYIDGIPTVSIQDAASFECIQLQQFADFAPRMSRNKSTLTFLREDMREKITTFTPETTEARELIHDQPIEHPAGSTKVNEAKRQDGLFEYHSILNEFPQNYGLREKGSASTKRPIDVRRRQFKTYLLFFEKIMVDYLERLKGFEELLSVHQNENPPEEFSKLRALLPDIEDLGLVTEEAWDQSSLSSQDKRAEIVRRHRIVDHLLARFASTYQPRGITPPDVAVLQQTLEEKLRLLHDIPAVTRDRGLGLPFRGGSDVWNRDDLVSGFQQRVYRLLGIREDFFSHIKHSAVKGREPSGFYVVEHILLVEKEGRTLAVKKFNNAATVLYDYILHMSKEYAAQAPYSFQLTIVLPNWYAAWRDQKSAVEKIIRAEIPAHILPYFHWINKKNMTDFETCYEDWLKALIQLNDYAR